MRSSNQRATGHSPRNPYAPTRHTIALHPREIAPHVPPALPADPTLNALSARRHARVGAVFGIAAYLWWGLVPLYFKLLAAAPAIEVLAHRVVWSAPLLALLVFFRHQSRSLVAALTTPRSLLTLCCSASLIAANWFVYIWAVTHDRVLEGSLGYFINPLVNVLLGVLLLGERLRRWQVVSVLLAAIGVLWLSLAYGKPPWLSLALAVSFGLYGLLRKVAPVESLVGLTAETALMWPIAAAYLAFILTRGQAAFGDAATLNALLVLAGPVTAVPLLWFAASARRLRLATVGLLQYISPTFQLMLAVLWFGEAFTRTHLVAFGCIWAALALYTADALRPRRARTAHLPPAAKAPAAASEEEPMVGGAACRSEAC